MFPSYISSAINSFFGDLSAVIPKSCKCCVCDAFITGQYYKHPVFDDDIFCVTHDPNRVCFCCHRHEPLPQTGREGFAVTADGRKLCLDCVSAVASPEEIKMFYDNAIDFMEHVLGLTIPKNMRSVPISQVSQPRLRALLHERSLGTDALGLTVYQEMRVSAMGFFTVTASRNCNVYVLDSLQRDLCAKVIVHEAMHVWIKLNTKFSNTLPGQTEEGLCEYMAAQWLEYVERTSQFQRDSKDSSLGASGIYCQEVPPSSRSRTFTNKKQSANPVKEFADRQSQLRKFFRISMEKSPCPIYGEGFRRAKRACDCMGLQNVLTYVSENSTLPVDGV